MFIAILKLYPSFGLFKRLNVSESDIDSCTKAKTSLSMLKQFNVQKVEMDMTNCIFN